MLHLLIQTQDQQKPKNCRIVGLLDFQAHLKFVLRLELTSLEWILRLGKANKDMNSKLDNKGACVRHHDFFN